MRTCRIPSVKSQARSPRGRGNLLPNACRLRWRDLTVLLTCFCIACLSYFGFSNVRAFAFSPTSPASPAERIGEHRYRIGRVVVDTGARVITAPCRVNQRKGMIEYLAVAAEGKLHESVLQVDAEPLHLHVALLLLGLEPGPRPRYQGDPLSPLGVRKKGTAGGESNPLPERAWVEARVSWQAGGREREARLEELAWDIPASQPMAPVAWLFTGAAVPGRGPWTMEERSVVATYRDPDAVLNNPLPSGGDDTVYKANERLIPPVGTPVTLLLRPAERPS
jgi:hypothetical protein